MIRIITLAAAALLALAGTAQAGEAVIDGEGENRSVVYLGVQPTQVGGAVVHVENTGDGPQIVTDRVIHAQRGPVARITGGGDEARISYDAPAPRG